MKDQNAKPIHPLAWLLAVSVVSTSILFFVWLAVLLLKAVIYTINSIN